MFRRKTTFAFILAALFASQVFAANPWLAEKNGQSILKAELPPCTADGPAQNRAFTVRDCTTKISCASTGTETVRMVCDGTTWRALNATATAVDLGDYVLITKAGQQSISATGAGNDVTANAEDDVILNPSDAFTVSSLRGSVTTSNGNFSIQANGASAELQLSAELHATLDSPIVTLGGATERLVTDVTVADDGAGTKPAAVIPITSDYVTCTCNDATGCASSIAEPTPTAEYGMSITILSKGTGNCEFADSAGVLEIGTTVVLEPTSVLTLVYMNSQWSASSYKDNVP